MGIITISRGSYSRGKEIAEKLSKKLGYQCISREVLLKASRDFNVPEVKLLQAIQNAPSVLDRLKHGKKKYIAFIRKAFLERIQKDNVIYHGLAGQFFTREIPNILKVRITADLDFRIKVVMKRENVSEEKAHQLINKIDEERSKWSMFLYGIDAKDPELYDIILHIHNMSVDDAVEILFNFAKRPCFKTTTETHKKLEDMVLAAKAYSVIVKKFPDANVKCKDGVIQISVESSLAVEEKLSKKFAKLLRNIEGVKEVKTFVIPFEV